MQTFLDRLFPSELDSRLYTHLLYKASSKYAAYYPSSHRLGDYGTLDRKTGEFVREGNLVDDFPEQLGKHFGPENVTEIPEAYRVFKQGRGYSIHPELDLSVGAPALVDCSIKAGWSHERDRFAALVLIDPILVSLRYEKPLYEFLISLVNPKSKPLVSASSSSLSLPQAPSGVDPSRYKGKALITQMYKCTSYALLLTNGSKGSSYAGFKFGAPAPIPSPAPVTASVKPSYEWKVHGESGSWSTGVYEKDNYKYTPLVTLRSIREMKWTGGFRGHPDTYHRGANGVEKIPDCYPPWADLDENGEEITDDDSSDDDEEDDDED